MKQLIIFLFTLGFVTLSSHALAELTIAEKQAAMMQAMELLKNSSSRQQYILNNKTAGQAHVQVLNLTNSPETQDKIYGIAANIFEGLVNKTGGDPNKLMKLMQNAQSNPEGFANQFTPAQKQELKQLGEQIMRQQGR